LLQNRIDVKGKVLSFEPIKQLVYANVMMMDSYMAGIRSVIYGDVELTGCERKN
jgi:uncharacterized protein (UPF0262 family)